MKLHSSPCSVYGRVTTWLSFITLVATATLARTAEPPPSTRLTHVGVARFFRDASGMGRLEKGWLSASGVFNLERSNPTVLPSNFPEDALGKRLMFTEAWFALGEQGPTALANFERADPGRAFAIGTLLYYEVQPSTQARTDSGLLGNISSRASLTPNATLIAGFIIHERPRKVVIRGVGPTLRQFDVLTPVEDPQLTVLSGSTVLAQNDNWSAGSPASTAALAAAFSQVGAFALPEGSTDAALLIELPPGAYTAHLRSAAPLVGDALLEVYVLP